jgi:hypothetical protein
LHGKGLAAVRYSLPSVFSRCRASTHCRALHTSLLCISLCRAQVTSTRQTNPLQIKKKAVVTAAGECSWLGGGRSWPGGGRAAGREDVSLLAAPTSRRLPAFAAVEPSPHARRRPFVAVCSPPRARRCCHARSPTPALRRDHACSPPRHACS